MGKRGRIFTRARKTTTFVAHQRPWFVGAARYDRIGSGCRHPPRIPFSLTRHTHREKTKTKTAWTETMHICRYKNANVTKLIVPNKSVLAVHDADQSLRAEAIFAVLRITKRARVALCIYLLATLSDESTETNRSKKYMIFVRPCSSRSAMEKIPPVYWHLAYENGRCRTNRSALNPPLAKILLLSTPA